MKTVARLYSVTGTDGDYHVVDGDGVEQGNTFGGKAKAEAYADLLNRQAAGIKVRSYTDDETGERFQRMEPYVYEEA